MKARVGTFRPAPSTQVYPGGQGLDIHLLLADRWEMDGLKARMKQALEVDIPDLGAGDLELCMTAIYAWILWQHPDWQWETPGDPDAVLSLDGNPLTGKPLAELALACRREMWSRKMQGAFDLGALGQAVAFASRSMPPEAMKAIAEANEGNV